MRCKRAEVMVTGQISEYPEIDVFINGNEFKQRNLFKYLGISASNVRVMEKPTLTELSSIVGETKMGLHRQNAPPSIEE